MENSIVVILEFLLWTLYLYVVHRVVHVLPEKLKQFHMAHHGYAVYNNDKQHWRPNNLLLFNDNWPSTIDLWITEVIPTALFAYVTGIWWVAVFHYLWAAVFQENTEHNSNINIPVLTCGRWHMLHHYNPDRNFSLFFRPWDILFGTYLAVDGGRGRQRQQVGE